MEIKKKEEKKGKKKKRKEKKEMKEKVKRLPVGLRLCQEKTSRSIIISGA